MEAFSPNTTFHRSELSRCNDRINDDPDLRNIDGLPVIVINDNSILDGDTTSRSKVSRSSSNTESLGYSKSSKLFTASGSYCFIVSLLVLVFMK